MNRAVVLVMIFVCIGVQGALQFSNTLGDNMVLQRAPLQASIWGWAGASDTVSYSLMGPSNQTGSVTADGTGAWIVTFQPVSAGGPYVIAVSDSEGDKTTLSNVLFGDVYLCGGQSNMQFTVDSAYNSSAEVVAANNYPNVRVMTVGQVNISFTPLLDLAYIEQQWSVADQNSIGGGNWSYFSAVCWFFGRDLYDTYQVPIGLISSNWGGTYVQAWSSPAALAKCPSENIDMDMSAKPNLQDPPNPNQPSVLWNAMIVPFLNATIRGAIWYQGESNSGAAQAYACQFPAMIQDWRNSFGTGFQFPFFFVQLAPWIAGADTSIPDTRQAQLAALALPEVGFATAVDLGDALSPYNNIHPRDKQTVGARLVLSTRAVAYGESVVWQGPMFNNATASVSGSTATAVVNWTLYGTGSLVYQNASCPVSEGVPADTCQEWEIGLSDGNWYAATASSSGSTSTVTLDNIASGATVTGVRYAYSAWPICTLYSEQNLPAIPFEHAF